MRRQWFAMALVGLVLLMGAVVPAPAQDAAAKAEVMALYHRAEALETAGQLREATKLYEKAVAKAEVAFGPTHPATASLMNNLAELYKVTGQYAKAEPLYQRSLKIYETKRGKDHPDVALSLHNLAELYSAMGQYEKAEPLLQRSLKIREAKLPKDHPDVALSLNNLAVLYKHVGQYEKAEPLYQRSLKIREAKLPKDHPDVAQSLHNLAALYASLGQNDKAEPLYQRSLKIREAKLGKDHPDVALSLNNLAGLYKDMGQNEKAEPLFQRSLKIREAKLPQDHPNVVVSLNNLAALYARTGKEREAARLLDRARRGTRRHLAAVLPALSEPEKAAFFQNTGARANLERALSLGLAHKSDATLAAQSASWLLNGKALDQEALATSLLLARKTADPDLGKRASQLLSVRRELARLSLSAARPGQEKQRAERIEELTNEEQNLGKRLRQAGSKAAPPTWVELADLRKSLSADAVLIDVAHFRPFDFKAKRGKEWQAARYAAWITPKAGPVRVIDLGPATEIDAAVKQFREAMNDAGKLIQAKGEEHAEKVVRERLDALSKLVLAPLLPHAGKSKRWLVGLDGNLWLVPWEALTLPGGEYAIKKHHVSYVTSGRDLFPSVAPKVTRTAPLVLADPDFDLDLRAATALPRPPTTLPRPRPKLPQPRKLPGPGSRAGGLSLGRVPRLPGTAAEARAITPSLKAYAGAEPRVYTRERALTTVFRAARSPRVLVLCTHGFFLPDREVPADDKDGPGKAKPVKKWENPLLRCGLLLTGCNKAAGGEGVLTGLEVVGTDLRGTELVVLSACDTGLGDIQVGEGVAGLRQAFQLAGAQAVVSTLWQVPDKQSARLMALFFQNLSKGMGKSDALRAAKLKIIGERRDDFAAAHPFFWAAFTLTGEP